MSGESYNKVFKLIERSFEMQIEALQLQQRAIVQLLQLTSNADTKTTNIINTLVSPENGDIYTVDELAKILKVSRATIYKWVQSGKIPHTKPNSGKVLFYKYQLTEFLQKQKNYEHNI